MNEIQLKVQGLTKSWSEGFRLGPLDLVLKGGETVAIHGKNGAGKSTLLSLLTGNLDASSGSVWLNEYRLNPDTPQLKQKIGYLPQNPHLPPWATAMEVLSYAAALYGLSSASDALVLAESTWDFKDFAHKPLATLSYGMHKRIGLALATLANPPILILDEPYSGLDIYHIKALDDTLLKRQSEGLLNIISTHIAPYTAKTCQRVLMLHQGQLSEIKNWGDLDFLTRIARIEAYFFGETPA